MTKEQAIAKYNLQREYVDCFGDSIDYELYSKEEWNDGVLTSYTVMQDELAKDCGEDLYFLLIETFDYNKGHYNKHGLYLPKMRTIYKELTA